MVVQWGLAISGNIGYLVPDPTVRPSETLLDAIVGLWDSVRSISFLSIEFVLEN